VALLVLASAAASWAQDRILPQTLFNRADRALQSGHFQTAYTDFAQYADEYPASPAQGAALLGAAKAAVYSDQPDLALAMCDRYMREHPNQPALALALLYRGHALVSQYRLEDAIEAYGDGYRAATDRAVRFAFRTVTENLAAQLEPGAAVELISIDLPPDMAAAAWSSIGEGLDASGQRYRAAMFYGRIAERYPDDPAGIAAKVRQRELQKLLATTVRIGLLMPLTGPLAPYGEDVRQGVALAAGEYSDSTGREVDILVEDTGGEAVKATRNCQSLLEQDPLAVIGPLTSHSAIGCAAASAAREIPLVVPAATETGLSTLGDAVYCLSPSVTTYGRTLGNYAVENLQLCTHLIIAPNDAYGYEMAAAYRDAVEAAGGEIWHETYYESGITDFGPYLRAYKSSFLDTLSDTTWFYAPDSTRYDDEEITVYPDAVFAPGYANDLVLLLPQIRFYKIAGRLIGTDSFSDEDLLQRAGSHLEDAIFGSVQSLAEGVMQWETFSARFSRKFGHSPTRMAALGYDSFRFMVGGLTDSLVTPRDLGRYLDHVDEFDGTVGHYRFGPDGDNTRVPIYYIRDRQIAPAAR
jgi:branched-chain amino acid transport system substrate-binding protein